MSEPDPRLERARAAREALIGKTIANRYVLRGLLGHGGMGAVYEAEHVGLGKRAAIKFVDPEFATDEQVVARFAREARAMSAIESAHIVTVFDAGTEDGRPYLVMELLRGEDLGQRLRRTRRVPLNEAMHVIAQVLKGLARAHAAGIIHRDLKPDNVFLVKHDTDPLFAKIVDFGISKIERPRAHTQPLALTGRGTVLGTPFYMSPEQAQAATDVDGRTDLYSVGAILFECLTGRPPHTGESYEQIILSICMRDAPRVSTIDASVPPEVSTFVARALSRDRAKRFASAEIMLAALHEVAPEERARVPLDPMPDTVPSPNVAPNAATQLDAGGAARSSSPSVPDEISAATRLGVATLLSAGAAGVMEAGAEATDAQASAGPSTRKATPKAKAQAPKTDAASKPASKATHAPAKSADPPATGKRPIGVAIGTAALATLTGVGVTFAIIAMLDKKPDNDGAGGISITTSSVTRAPSSASTMTTTVASVSPSGSTSSPALSASSPSSASSSAMANADGGATPPPPSTASSKPGTPSGARSAGTGSTPTSPRPTSTKPLDIQRDLP